MKYIYTGDSGMIPNIGQFENGQELSGDVAQKLIAAGYSVSPAVNVNTAPQSINEEGEQA